MSVDERPIINYLIRMVVPMKREFQRHLDVSLFLHDPGYARQILSEALTTQDPRLKEFATYVAERMRNLHGAAPRPPARIAPEPSPIMPQRANGSAVARSDNSAPPPPLAQAHKPLDAAREPSSAEAILLARLERYRKGLR